MKQVLLALFLLPLTQSAVWALFMSSGGVPPTQPPSSTITSVTPSSVSIPDTTAQNTTILQYTCHRSDGTTPPCTYSLHAGSVLPGLLTLSASGALTTNTTPILSDCIPTQDSCTWLVDAVVGGPPQTISQVQLSCTPSCGFNVGTADGTSIGSLSAPMDPAMPAFAGSFFLVSSGATCTHTEDTTNFQITGTLPNFVLATKGTSQTPQTYYVCVRAIQTGLTAVTQEFAVVGSSNTQAMVATSLPCGSSCGFLANNAGVIGNLSTTMNPASPQFAGSYALVNGTGSGGVCTHTPDDTSHFSLGAGYPTPLNTSGPGAGTYYICIQATQATATNSPIYNEITIVASPQTIAATTPSCSLSCTFVPGTPGVVGTLATGMAPTTPQFAGNYQLVSSGCTDPGDTTHFSLSGTGNKTLNTTAPVAGTYHVCAQTSQAGMSPIYSEFTIVGVTGPSSSAPAIGMTTLICSYFSAQTCNFPANNNNNSVSGITAGVNVFGLETGLVPADPTYGPYFYDPNGIHATTPDWTMVASNAACPDAGDTTHFAFAYKNGPPYGNTTTGVKMGLMPISNVSPGVYHICLQIPVPGAVNTPQYQEVTLTAVADNITGIIPQTFTFTTDAASVGAFLQEQCLSAVSPQCAITGWTMTGGGTYFTIADNGVITPHGTVPVGSYPLSVSVGSAGPYTLTINVVTPTNWNGGSYAGILSSFASYCQYFPGNPSFPPCPPTNYTSSNYGRFDVTDGYTSATGTVPCTNSLPSDAAGVSCGPSQGAMQYGYVASLGGSGIPTAVNFGILRGDSNWNPIDWGGGAHDNTCGSGYFDFYREAALNTPAFVQAMTNALLADFGSMGPQTYYLRLNWEGIDGASWYCHDATNSGAQLTGVPTLGGWAWAISPQTLALAQINTIKLIRQILPGVKITSTAPLVDADTQFTDPIAPYIDIWESDMGYWGTKNGTWTTGQQSWNDPQQQAFLTYIANYSHWTNKPVAFTEWNDIFTDAYATNAFEQWWLAHPQVIVSGFWDNGANGSPPIPSQVMSAFKSTMGSVAFTGNPMFPTPKTVTPAMLNYHGLGP